MCIILKTGLNGARYGFEHKDPISHIEGWGPVVFGFELLAHIQFGGNEYRSNRGKGSY